MTNTKGTNITKNKKPLSDYDGWCCVTEDALKVFSQAHFRYQGRAITFRNKDGSPKRDACLHAIGFNLKAGISTLHKGEGVFAFNESEQEVLVRHPEMRTMAQYCKVYAGSLRDGYVPPTELHHWLKKLSFNEMGDVIHVANSKSKALNLDEMAFSDKQK